jgi:hypothetical protein
MENPTDKSQQPQAEVVEDQPKADPNSAFPGWDPKVVEDNMFLYY